MVTETVNTLQAITTLLSVVVALVAIVVTWRISRQQQKYYFCEKQLKEFYGPLLALRLEIQALSNLRCETMSAAESAWGKKSSKADSGEKVDFTPYGKIIDHYNLLYKTKIRPLYRAMQKTFLDNIWLAEPETLEFLSKFVRYNESQDLILEEKIPSEVYSLIELKEEELNPFYTHLSATTELLKKKMR